MSGLSADESLDIVIVGAGLSGIGAAHHIQTRLPQKSFAILEGRERIGGTWDLFRYPGIRSDSDMFTLGYPFKPWTSDAAIAGGASILDYIREAASERGLDRKVRFNHTLKSAAWSSDAATWTLEVMQAGRPIVMQCRFLLICAGYYDYETGHAPDFPGRADFTGPIVHPQAWPEDLVTSGKNIVVIGSGATAVTLAPALVAQGAHVAVLQRSPSYVVALPSKDGLARHLQRLLPPRLAYVAIRWRNILLSIILYLYARTCPQRMRARLLALAQKQLGGTFDTGLHFNPLYNPWDQRLCVVPDGDLFKALKSGHATMVTDEIECFTERGIKLRSGRSLDADIIVTATGLRMKLIGGVTLSVDGRPIDLAQTTSYKGAMFSDVPNLAYALGYTNASWTLKSDLTSVWICRLIAYMDRHGRRSCVARCAASVVRKPLIDFTSGYVQRVAHLLPKQGDRKPWRLNQNYVLDMLAMKLDPIDDGVLTFPQGSSSGGSGNLR